MRYLVINHQLKLILGFNPKCGCSTLRQWFLQLPGTEPNRRGDFAPQHILKPEEIANYPEYQKVLFLRDPLRRLVSFYCHWVVRNDAYWCFADDARRFSLVGKSFRRLLYVLEHLQRHQLAFQHHLHPQLDGLEVKDFDRVVLVEQLNDGLEQLGRELGLNLTIGNINRTNYSTQTTQLVADRTPDWLRQNTVPHASCFYDQSALELASHCYANDVANYLQVEKALLPAVPG